MTPEMIATVLDNATRLVPVSTPLLALIGTILGAAALVVHAYAAYTKASAPKAPAADVRLPPPELK